MPLDTMPLDTILLSIPLLSSLLKSPLRLRPQLSHMLPISLMLEFTHMHFGDMDSHLPYLLLLLLRKMPLLLRLRPEKSVRLRLNLRLTPTIYTTILSPTHTLLSRK